MGRVCARTWSKGEAGLFRECVDASRNLRKTRGGSLYPCDMISGGSCHPFRSSLENMGLREISIGGGKGTIDVAGRCGSVIRPNGVAPREVGVAAFRPSTEPNGCLLKPGAGPRADMGVTAGRCGG